MKVLIMVLVMGLMGCVEENGKTYDQQVRLIGVDQVNLIDVYHDVDYQFEVITVPAVVSSNGIKYDVIKLSTVTGHFVVSFDVYAKGSGQFIKNITINSIDYGYTERVNINSL